MTSETVVNIDLQGRLPKIASGKVRDLYAIDDDTLLFVASDRISAYDVIMENVSSYFTISLRRDNGDLKTQVSCTPICRITKLNTPTGHTRQRRPLNIHVHLLVQLSSHGRPRFKDTLPI
jgi:phosphoribosylaminoimidazole-succinocarboxamide synthase